MPILRLFNYSNWFKRFKTIRYFLNELIIIYDYFTRDIREHSCSKIIYTRI